MRILHLSDLHLTGPFKNFEEIWSGPSPHLAVGSFDFVLISGDLSQRAAAHEYEQLRAFLSRSVLQLLKEPQYHRIVLVPGNHDVDWSADIGDRLSIEEQLAADESFGNKLRRAPLEPEKSHLRVSIGRYGHLDVLRIDPNRYPSRFKNVQDFLTAFYKDVPPSELFRSFALTDADEANHWSAHVFPESGIAFYGFSSCHGNDRYWTGAMFSARAIEQARLHAEKYARDCTRIAVWHHGLGSDRGRPDYLSTQDIGLLYNAGFRIGFHGHTHRAASKALDELFKNRFFIISTGSLGAGAEERPDAVGNQFSIAEVHHPSHVDVEVFSRDGTSGSFERNREKRRHTFLEPATPRLDQLSHAVSHQRTWTVASDGIARIDVELRDVTLYGEVPLAVIEQPFCSVQGRDKAETSTGQLPVMRTELPDGRIRFALNTGKDVKLDWLRWSYHVSNGVALNQMDLEARGKSHSSLDHLQPGFDGRSLHRSSMRLLPSLEQAPREVNPMKLLLGPILYAENQTDPEAWSFSVNLLLSGVDTSKPPPLRLAFRNATGQEVGTVSAPTVAADFSGLGASSACISWKWAVQLPRKEAEQRVSYRFDAMSPAVDWRMDDVKDVLVPARGALPRCAFFSCNGMSQLKSWATLDRPFALWEEMRRQQEQDAGFHVLIGGGDQLYTDSLWYTNPALIRFQQAVTRAAAAQPHPRWARGRAAARLRARLYRALERSRHRPAARARPGPLHLG